MCRPCAAGRRKRSVKAAQGRWLAKNPNYRSTKNKEFYAANREREKARAQAWRDENVERTQATSRVWRGENKERHAENQKAWHAANKARRSEYRKAKYAVNRDRELTKAREWKRHNSARVQAINAARLAAQLRATPAWADHDKIAEFYAESARLTRETGIVHHVDHIVPLRSKWVCGLHVHTNLQVLPAAENQSKSNRRWPYMPDELRS